MSRPETSPNVPRDRPLESRVCVLVACFAGTKRAGKVRGQIGKSIKAVGGTVIDEAILTVKADRKTLVYDPRRTVAGTLTPALTWGVFGLIAGGLQGLWVWGIIGAICGGVNAYLTEHLATKDELKQIGDRLPSDSSAIAIFVQGADPQRMLSSVAPVQAVTSSIAAIASDLSADVYADDAHPIETSHTTGSPPAANRSTLLSMLLVRFPGEHGGKALAASTSAKHPDPHAPQVELLVEANKEGRRRVVDPTTGSAAFSKAQLVGWGVCGLVWGAIVGFAGGAGALGAIKDSLLIGVAWAIFGLIAGALYGLWAGRAVSARRLKRIGAFVPPDSSLVVAWAGEEVSTDAAERWAASGSDRLLLRFNPVGHGVLLEV